MGLFATLNPEQLGRVQRAKNAVTPFDLGVCLTQAFDALKRDFWNVVLMNLVFSLLCCFLITIPPLYVGRARFHAKVLRGEKAGFDDLMSGFDSFGSSWLMMIVMFVFIVIGFLFCFLPGFYLAYAWLLSFHLLADRRGSFWECLEIGRQAVTAHWGWAFLLYFVANFVSGLGIIACFIGILATAPILSLAVTAAYQRLFPETATGETVVQG
jgi:uncharacterized membrane protein